MVRAGSFLDLRPMADTRVLNLRGMIGGSLFLEEEVGAVEGYLSSSSARVESERLGRRESLEDFERDHHGLDWGGEEMAGGIGGIEDKERVMRAVGGVIKGTAGGDCDHGINGRNNRAAGRRVRIHAM